MGARLLRGQVVLLRSRHRLDRMARVRIEGWCARLSCYEGIQLGQGYKPGVTVLPPLRAFRGERVAAVRTGQGFQFVLPGVV